MWLRRNISLFANWPMLYLGSLVARLRNGLAIEMVSRHDIPILWEVIGERCYGQVRGETIVDLGANIGSFSLLAAKENPAARIYAFEPSEQNFHVLSRNILRNRFNNIEVRKLAIAGEAGTRTFHLSKRGDSGHNSFHAVAADDELVTVECTTLDSIIKEVGDIDFLKIDVEGAEDEILRASKRLAQVKRLIVEGDEAIADYLEEQGFVVFNPAPLIVFATRGMSPEHPSAEKASIRSCL